MDLLGQPFGFGSQDSFAQTRETVVSAALVVQFEIGTDVGLRAVGAVYDRPHFVQCCIDLDLPDCAANPR